MRDPKSNEFYCAVTGGNQLIAPARRLARTVE